MPKLDYLIPAFAAMAAILWLVRRRASVPPKQELAPPPRAPDPESQEIEKLILKMDEDMLALDAGGVEVPKPDDPAAPPTPPEKS